VASWTPASTVRLSGWRASAGRGWRVGWTSATHLPPTIDPPYRSGMDRRRFLLTSLAGALAVPRMAEAQREGKVWRIGLLVPASRPSTTPSGMGSVSSVT
jgi:hypothetical protein